MTGRPEVTKREGTVFDIGYQNYTGPREGRGRARISIIKNGVRTSLGFGRGALAKVLPWLFIAVLVFIAIIMALVAGAADRLIGPEDAEQPGSRRSSSLSSQPSAHRSCCARTGVRV